MALKTPYATVTEANSYLSDSDEWSDLTTTEKNNHLLNGRYYIDANYSCIIETDTNGDEVIPEEFVYANSLLANISTINGLFNVDKTLGNAIVKKKSVAGPVESEITYAGSRSTNTNLNSIDSYPQVTSLLSEYCSRSKSSMNSINLLRA